MLIPSICTLFILFLFNQIDETCEAPIKINSYYRKQFKQDGVSIIEWSQDSKYLATKNGISKFYL